MGKFFVHIRLPIDASDDFSVVNAFRCRPEKFIYAGILQGLQLRNKGIGSDIVIAPSQFIIHLVGRRDIGRVR